VKLNKNSSHIAECTYLLYRSQTCNHQAQQTALFNLPFAISDLHSAMKQDSLISGVTNF